MFHIVNVLGTALNTGSEWVPIAQVERKSVLF